MPQYKRVFAPGGTFFFTVVTHKRAPLLCVASVRKALREAIGLVRKESPFDIDAWVLLPDHLHCIWTLPEGDTGYSMRWANIKRHVTKVCRELGMGLDGSSPSRTRRKDGGFWQRRFWEHQIRDGDDFNRHMDYIHYNPVKHGQVNRVGDWAWSTFHRHVKRGIYEETWGGGDIDGDFGEV